MAETRSVAITVALIGAAATIVAAVIATRGGDGGSETGNGFEPPAADGKGSASVFLSRDSGPGGSEVNVSGEGFGAGERVVISFHTEQIGSTTASQQGAFSNVTVTIPTSFSKFAPQQFFIEAHGEDSIRTARAPFTITG